VVYPVAELYFDAAGDPDGYVTMINPHRVKGVDTFFEIARRLPAEKFLLLESWKLNDAALASLQPQLTQAPNVLFVRRVSDMRSIYRQTKLLIVPSIWEEGFGMVAIEAQSCRIPVIASARGGLPESVGDGGILIQDFRNAGAWVEAIGEVLGDAPAYSEWSRRALRHASAENFAPPQLARRFLETCSTQVPFTAWHIRVLYAVRDRLREIPVLGRLFRRVYR
jgi:glycosyltransferase involved in cell wall biosynthesis